MKKRLVTLIVAGTLIMSSLAGCGSVSDTETDVTPQATEETFVEDAETPAEESTVEETTESVEEAKAIEATEHLTNGRASLYGLDGTEINLETAYNEFTKAVELGNVDANFYLGLLCDWYNYPELDYEMSKAYYEASGENAYAKINLAFLYLYGQGVEKDTEKASTMFQEVIDQGCVEGYIGSAYIAYDEGDYVTAFENFNKVLEGKEQVYSAFTMEKLGGMYYDGNGVEQDYAKALECYEKSAYLGYMDGYDYAGVMYYSGEGTEQDFAKAKELWEKGVALGNTGSMYNLAWMYENGDGVEQNYEKALELYQMSADAGNTRSMNALGYFYSHGYGVEQDYTKALEWYDKSAELGNESAKENAEQIRSLLQ